MNWFCDLFSRSCREIDSDMFPDFSGELCSNPRLCSKDMRLYSGHLVVNLGFWNIRFSISAFVLVSRKIFEKYGGEKSRNNKKGVLDRPWTKRRVLRAIYSTFKFQFTIILKDKDLTIR